MPPSPYTSRPSVAAIKLSTGPIRIDARSIHRWARVLRHLVANQTQDDRPEPSWLEHGREQQERDGPHENTEPGDEAREGDCDTEQRRRGELRPGETMRRRRRRRPLPGPT